VPERRLWFNQHTRTMCDMVRLTRYRTRAARWLLTLPQIRRSGRKRWGF
jgi:hypothetical protein